MFLLKKHFLLLFSFLVLAFLLNLQSMSYYFFQDDWFVLNSVKNISPENYLNIFQVRNDIIYYRPLAMQSFFLLLNSLFGLNNFAFHIVSFFFFSLDVILIYSIFKELSKNKNTGLFAAFIFTTASFHFMTFSWLSLTWNFIGLTFILLALKLVLKGKQLYSYCMFILALLSTEFAIIFPFFALALLQNQEKKFKLFTHLKLILPYIVTIALYLIIRLLLIPLPTEGTYQPVIGFNIAKDYLWYMLWFLNVPELLKTHLSVTEFKIASDFRVDTNGLASFIPILLTLEVTFLGLLFYKVSKRLNLKVVLSSFALFAISLAPVISLPNHSYPYYLTLASLPLIYVIAQTLTKSLAIGSLKIVTWLFLLTYLASSVLSLQINYKTHWIPGEQEISQKVAQIALIKKDTFPTATAEIAIYPSSSMAKLALMDQEAMKFIYNDNVATNYLKNPKEASDSSVLIFWDN